MKRVVYTVLALVTARAACADVIAPTGQPFCTGADESHGYLLAALDWDCRSHGQMDGCAIAKGALRMEVINEGKDGAGMHVDRSRLFGPKASALGHLFNVDQ